MLTTYFQKDRSMINEEITLLYMYPKGETTYIISFSLILRLFNNLIQILRFKYNLKIYILKILVLFFFCKVFKIVKIII